ncbi:MAG: XRE family transcriptional regulator [Chitinophagaceae bacterium]|nr:MAG: XRE family transcriptional regulator [Chitinophagaceae bacterium]
MRKPIEILFGEALRDLRTKAGLSQEALAYESDLDRSFISMLERGLKQPTISTLFSLSKPLRVKPSDFIKLIEEGNEG